jgi:hypothetical protein
MDEKEEEKAQMGEHVSLLDTHLVEFIWCRRFDDCSFQNLFGSIQQNIPCSLFLSKHILQ